jgi:hypothetical protein
VARVSLTEDQVINFVFSNDVLSGVVSQKLLYSDVFVITEDKKVSVLGTQIGCHSI